MRLAVLCSHDLHRRNLYDSGLVAMLERRGHTVINLGANPPTFNRLRRSLRLMTMVDAEPRNPTYFHKSTLLRGRRRLQASVWRAVRRMGVDLEALALRIEARLPLPAHTLKGCAPLAIAAITASGSADVNTPTCAKRPSNHAAPRPAASLAAF